MGRFRIETVWRLRATREEVVAVLSEPERLPEWWGEVYLAAREVARGGEDGVGREVELWTRGWLPYTLRWGFRVTEVGEDRVVLVPRGDFRGRGVWSFEREGELAVVRYLWDVEARKPLLRALIWAKPLLAWNHRWAMSRGGEGLAREIARRRRIRGPASP